MSSKEAMLARIRNALLDVNGEQIEVMRDYRLQGSSRLDHEAVVEQFIERASEYKATIHVTTVLGLPGALAKLLSGTVRSVVVAPGVPQVWLSEVPVGEVRTVRDDSEIPLDPHQLAEFDTVLTGSRLGVALTGTIVLDGAPLSGRRGITLVPDHHVCVIETRDIVATVPDAIAALDARAPLTWVSGPSATSDIELDRVEGVHGPRRLDVVVVR